MKTIESRARIRDRIPRPDGPRRLLINTGEMVTLAGQTARACVLPPYGFGLEFVHQLLFILRLCWAPMLISTIAFGYGANGVEGAGILAIFGGLDRLGGLYVVSAIRDLAPFISSIVVAGIAGTAIIADLGARKIREELDALHVLGVDTVKHLVAPRFLALMLSTALLDVFAMIFGFLSGVLICLVFDTPLQPFFATIFTTSSTTEVAASVLQCVGFGAIVGIVCCYYGLSASGGAEGVGRAVNRGVVVAMLGTTVFDFTWTQILLATHPDLSVAR